jgi:phosphate transport system substrate-binding protein
VAEADETQIKVLTVNGVKPSAATLKDKTYPIGRTPTLATKGEAAGEEKAFVDFVLSAKGQAVVAKEGLVPIQ